MKEVEELEGEGGRGAHTLKSTCRSDVSGRSKVGLLTEVLGYIIQEILLCKNSILRQIGFHKWDGLLTMNLLSGAYYIFITV